MDNHEAANSEPERSLKSMGSVASNASSGIAGRLEESHVPQQQALTKKSREIPVRKEVQEYYEHKEEIEGVKKKDDHYRSSIAMMAVHETRLLEGGKIIAEPPSRSKLTVNTINKSLMSITNKLVPFVDTSFTTDTVPSVDIRITVSSFQYAGKLDLDLDETSNMDFSNFTLGDDAPVKCRYKEIPGFERLDVLVSNPQVADGKLAAATVIVPKKKNTKVPLKFKFIAALHKVLEKSSFISYVGTLHGYDQNLDRLCLFRSFAPITMRQWREARLYRFDYDFVDKKIMYYQQSKFVLESLLGISAALKEIHKYGILHDSITPDHIGVDMVKEKWHAQLSLDNIDYSYQLDGLSKTSNTGWNRDNFKRYPTLLSYIAPERISQALSSRASRIISLVQNRNTFKMSSDIYSFCQFAFFMVEGKDPQWLDDEIKNSDILKRVKTRQNQSPVSSKSKDILRAAIKKQQVDGLIGIIQAGSRYNPKDRPTFDLIIIQLSACSADLSSRHKAVISSRPAHLRISHPVVRQLSGSSKKKRKESSDAV